MFQMWFPFVPIGKMCHNFNWTVGSHLLKDLKNQLSLDVSPVINKLSPEVQNEGARTNFSFWNIHILKENHNNVLFGKNFLEGLQSC